MQVARSTMQEARSASQEASHILHRLLLHPLLSVVSPRVKRPASAASSPLPTLAAPLLPTRTSLPTITPTPTAIPPTPKPSPTLMPTVAPITADGWQTIRSGVFHARDAGRSDQQDRARGRRQDRSVAGRFSRALSTRVAAEGARMVQHHAGAHRHQQQFLRRRASCGGPADQRWPERRASRINAWKARSI